MAQVNLDLAKESTSQEILEKVAEGVIARFAKSYQYVTYSVIAGETSGSVSINTVDPAKCFVLFERLKDTSSISRVRYTLNEDSIYIEHPSLNGGTLECGFWVIELY